MDSNSSDYLSNHATLPSLYYQGNREDGKFIDLGLSLRVLQPQAYYPSVHGGYDELIDWQHLHPQLRNNSRTDQYPTNFVESYDDDNNNNYPIRSHMVGSGEDDVYADLILAPKGTEKLFPEDPRFQGIQQQTTKSYDDEAEGIQSKESWAYVKVNMDRVIVGRKICILEHSDYSTLAIQLEDMFGKQSISGLRLFQDGSEFSLFYKGRDEQWRAVGDVPWNQFTDRVKRLRIVRKDEVFITNSSALLSSV